MILAGIHRVFSWDHRHLFLAVSVILGPCSHPQFSTKEYGCQIRVRSVLLGASSWCLKSLFHTRSSKSLPGLMTADAVFCSQSIVRIFSRFLMTLSQFQICTCSPSPFGSSFLRCLSQRAAESSGSSCLSPSACSLKFLSFGSFFTRYPARYFYEW